MKEAKEFFEKFRAGLLGGLYTGALAKVEKYDPSGMADIIILPGGDLINSVPVATLQSAGYYIRVPLAKGDIVAVMFASRSIDGVMHSDPEDGSERTHDINDAIIMGGINLFNNPLPSTDPDKLVIAAKTGGASIVLGTDGKVTIAAPEGVTLQGKTRSESW